MLHPIKTRWNSHIQHHMYLKECTHLAFSRGEDLSSHFKWGPSISYHQHLPHWGAKAKHSITWAQNHGKTHFITKPGSDGSWIGIVPDFLPWVTQELRGEVITPRTESAINLIYWREEDSHSALFRFKSNLLYFQVDWCAGSLLHLACVSFFLRPL